VDLDGILYGHVDVEEDRDSILLNPIASTITKWLTFELLSWVQRNSLITVEPICGFGWNFVWTC
jgi:hypothetical protein